MKYFVALSSLICFCLAGCVDQPPAPIEYKERGVTVSSSSNIIDNDEGIISSNAIVEVPEPKKVSGSLEEPKIEATEDDNDVVEIPTMQQNEETINSNFVKPLEGEIITEFEEGKSKGIDIAVPQESKVKSIASGTVIYSGSNKQFGNLVIVKLDEDNLEVAYAGLKDLSVKKGSKIAKGDIVGYVEDKLHLAMRKGKVAVDPANYIVF